MASEHSVPKLVGSVLLCEAAGGIGSMFTRNSLKEWYPNLEKPSFTPPGWIFGPVWALLYALMRASFYVAERQHEDGSGEARASRVLFGIQLVLNTLWSYVFFGRRSPAWALVEIGFLWAAIVATILTFSKVSKMTTLLMLPYLLWTSFATVLNYEVWRLKA